MDPETRNVSNEASVQDIGGTFTIFIEVATSLVNIMSLTVVIRGKTYRTRSTTEDIILVLSVLYILSAVVPSQIAHVSYFENTWIGGETTCKIYQFLFHSSRLSTLCAVAVLALNQTLCAFHFLNMRDYSYQAAAKTKVICIIMLNILACVIISSMPMVGLGPEAFRSTHCQFWLSFRLRSVNEFAFLILFLCFGFCNILLIASSVVINLCCKSLIKKRICTTSADDRNNTDMRWHSTGSKVLSGNNLVLAVSVPVLVTWVPAMILALMRQVNENISDVSILYALLSTSVSGMVNPIIYGLCDASFRRGYRRLFHVLCNIKQMAPVPDHVVTRSTSGVETLASDAQRSFPPSSSSSGFINSAFESQAIPDYASGLLSHDELDLEKSNQNCDIEPFEKTQLLVGRCSKYTAKNTDDNCEGSNENLSSLSEDMDLYEDLSSNRSSDDDDSLDEKEKETFI